MIKTVFSDKNYCLFHLSAFLSVCSLFDSESVFSMLYMSVVCQFFFSGVLFSFTEKQIILVFVVM